MGNLFALVMATPAKINFGLAINNKRPDGFHNLETVFQAISLYDQVEVKLKKERGISCFCGPLSGEKNLASRAAEIFLKHYAEKSSSQNPVGVEITIEKHIPLQAGLGGGSSDAAAVFRALNLLLERPFSETELLGLAQKCGSDTAFFIKGGTQWGEETGSKLTVLPSLEGLDLILVQPSQGISTSEVYRLFDESGRYSRLNRNLWQKICEEKDFRLLANSLENSLETAAFRLVPEIKKIKDLLLEFGCEKALMSGSGSAVFGLLSSPKQGQQLAKRLVEAGFPKTWVVKTIRSHADSL
ncbi:MAG: 4-(cytidine 5'-diphospho)-2-C-methyl-D-erythritol kinase [Desulfitobacteriia bacterium]|jgi:4-diphosphocytidyl-2-C-methyl-D-erythritol kinase